MEQQRLGALANGKPDPLTPGPVSNAFTSLGTSLMSAGSQGANAINSLGASATKPIYDTGKTVSDSAVKAAQPVADTASKQVGGYTKDLASSWNLPKVQDPNQPTQPASQPPAQQPQAPAQTGPGAPYAADITARILNNLNFETAYQRAHGFDPQAIENNRQRVLNSLQAVQDMFRQRDDEKLARKAGIVTDGGDVLVMGADGKPHVQSSTRSLDEESIQAILHPKTDEERFGKGQNGFDAHGRPATIYTPSPGVKIYRPRNSNETGPVDQKALDSMAKSDKATDDAIRKQDLLIAQGLDEKGNKVAEPDPVMLKAIQNGTYNPRAKGTINGVPGNDYLNQTAQNDYRQGIVTPGSPAEQINNAINQRLHEGKGFSDLLTKFDKAAAQPDFNRSKVGTTGNPSVVANHGVDANGTNMEGTVTNKQTGDLYTRQNAAGPVTPTADSIREYLQARDALNQRTTGTLPTSKQLDEGYTVKGATYPVGKNSGSPGEVNKEGVKLTGANAMEQKQRDQMKAEEVRWNKINASKQMEEAMKPQPNGDPLHDSKIARDRAEAAQAMATANGESSDQAVKYLRPSNDFNAPSSEKGINDLAMQHLRGDSMEQLVRTAAYNNASGSQISRRQNERAIKQAGSTEAIDYKEEVAKLKKERDENKEGAADRNFNKSLAAKTLEVLQAQANQAMKDYKSNEINKFNRWEDTPEGKDYAVKIRNVANSMVTGEAIPASIFKPKDVDENSTGGQSDNNTPQPKSALPPKDKLETGKVYDTQKGKAEWDGKHFIPV